MGKLVLAAVVLVVMVASWAGREYAGLPLQKTPLDGILGSDRSRMRDCTAGFDAGFRSSLPDYATAYLSEQRIQRASERLCAHWVARPGSERTDADSGPRMVTRMFRAQPRLYTSLCQPVLNADLAASKPNLVHVSRGELRRYRGQFCRLSIRYLDEDTARVDLPALLHAHAGLWSPLCASSLQQGALTPVLKRAYSELQLRIILRRACTRGVRTGAIDVSGPHGFLDAELDERAFERILVHAARGVAG